MNPVKRARAPRPAGGRGGGRGRGLWRPSLIGALLLAQVCAAAASALSIYYGAGKELVLSNRDARQQLLVSRARPDGSEEDVTRQVEWAVEPAGVVAVDKRGRVTPLSDGECVIRARLPGADDNSGHASVRALVKGFGRTGTVDFVNQVVPIFTKRGCNGGGCHGNAAGQNGFRLSLLGFEPREDYERLVKEARGRRLFPGAPERSLLVTKSVAEVPHGGGKRLEMGSEDYRILVRWIAQGMPFGDPEARSVERIEVFPSNRVLGLNSDQQLAVTAHYSDGTTEDVTANALYEANEKEIAEVDENGHVTTGSQPGEVAVMVRYQARVGVFRALIPLGAAEFALPTPRSFVDRHVFDKLRRVSMPPSAVCADATFIRRATLDITGRLPTPEEILDFKAAARADDPAATDHLAEAAAPPLTPARIAARDAVIDRLLDSGAYADYFAGKWSALLRNKRTNKTHARGTYSFHGWIRESLLQNRPYDEFVRDLLTATGDVEDSPPVMWYRQVNNMTAQLEDTAQLFLGTRMQCAQCHHHPYEKWSQEDYYGLAAFFAQVGRKPGSRPGEQMIYHKRGVATATHKKTRAAIRPAGLGAPPAALSPEEDPRIALADWMIQESNPFFAASLVNRYWKHFMGRGLVEPEDDMRETNPPTHPELLDALAAHFRETGYDLKALIRVICQSTAYQLSSEPTGVNRVDKQFYARFYPRRLPAEVLYDAIDDLSGARSRFDGLPEGTRAVQLPDNSFNASSYFLTVFGRPESSSACECERTLDASLAQSIHLLNSKEIQQKLSAKDGRAVEWARGADAAAALKDLYRRALAREPVAAELEIAKARVQRATGAGDSEEALKARREAYEDVLWALLNSKEFLFNH